MHLLFVIYCAVAGFCTLAGIGAMELPENLRAHARKLHSRCQKQSGVPAELLHPTTADLPSDRTLQCYLHCLFDTVGLIDENHVIHLELIMDILPSETHGIIQNLINSCGTQHGADGCETAYLTVQCYLNSDPKLRSKFDFIFD